MKKDTASQQYAALPWRQAAGPEILLITSRETRRWVIPKGWPIPAHSAAESAAQEAYEEAGIRGGMAAQPIGHYRYRKRLPGGAKKPFQVDVFGMEVTEVLDLWPEAHERTRDGFRPPRRQSVSMSRNLRCLSGHLPGINWDRHGQPQHTLKQSG